MTYTQIAYEVSDGVATVTLDRLDRLSAFTTHLMHELAPAYVAADLDDDVRVVVLTGRGRAFCARIDLVAGADAFDPNAHAIERASIGTIGGVHAMAAGSRP